MLVIAFGEVALGQRNIKSMHPLEVCVAFLLYLLSTSMKSRKQTPSIKEYLLPVSLSGLPMGGTEDSVASPCICGRTMLQFTKSGRISVLKPEVYQWSFTESQTVWVEKDL